jgi:hypothetical protein
MPSIDELDVDIDSKKIENLQLISDKHKNRDVFCKSQEL